MYDKEKVDELMKEVKTLSIQVEATLRIVEAHPSFSVEPEIQLAAREVRTALAEGREARAAYEMMGQVDLEAVAAAQRYIDSSKVLLAAMGSWLNARGYKQPTGERPLN